MSEKQTRIVAEREQINLGPCFVCGQRVWYTPGDITALDLLRQHGAPVHKRLCVPAPSSTGGREGGDNG